MCSSKASLGWARRCWCARSRRPLSLKVARVQFTPDLMPSDITGHAVLDPATHAMRVVRGPVFTNILLADEINRAPAKTQSALLEVMQEHQVTLEAETLLLPRPFMVLATQNPLDTEGTYPLPEAQLDRFLLKIDMRLSDAERGDRRRHAHHHRSNRRSAPARRVTPVLNERAILALQHLVARQRVDAAVVDYAVRIARATRDWPGSPWAAARADPIALVRAAKAAALIAARSFVLPDDVKRSRSPHLRHRIALSADAQLDGRKADDALDRDPRRHGGTRACDLRSMLSSMLPVADPDRARSRSSARC